MTDKLREQSIEFAKKHLFECAKEILEWGRTSILCDGKLRELAKTCEAWVRDESYALGVAEAIVKEEALRAALAQQDAQAIDHIPDAREMVSPTYGSEEVRKLRETIQSMARIIRDYEAAPTPAPKPLGWLDRKAVECLQGAELNWMPAWNRPTSSDPVPIFLSPTARATLTASEIFNMTPESIPAEHDGALLEYARSVIEAYENKNGLKL